MRTASSAPKGPAIERKEGVAELPGEDGHVINALFVPGPWRASVTGRATPRTDGRVITIIVLLVLMLPEAFQKTEFLGGRKAQQSNPDRLRLLSPHLVPGEVVVAVMPLKRSVLLLTDQRLLELDPHLESHNAWNVMGFTGFDKVGEMAVTDLRETLQEDAPDAPGTKGRWILRFRAAGGELAVITEVVGEATRLAVARLRELLHAT